VNQELPQGWAYVKLKELCKSFDYGTSAKSQPTGNVPVLRMGNLQSGRIDWTDLVYTSNPDEIKKYSLEPNTVLFNRTNSPELVGKTAIYRGERQSIFAGYLIRVNPLPCLDPEYLNLCLNTYYARVFCGRVKTDGVSQSNINAKKLAAFEVPFCPLAEQQRIVAKLEVLLGKVDACRKRLEKIPVILKRFRQSVLAAACSGRLTADWREQNPSGTVDEVADELPGGWKPVCVGDAIESLKYGTAQKCGYEKLGVPVLRIPNVANGTIDHADLKYADLPLKERSQLQLHPGDILLIRSNGSVSLVGKCAVVRETERGFAYAGYLIRLRPNPAVVEPEFLNMTLSGFGVRLQIELDARSTSGVNNINSEEVRALHFNLPLLPEQQEIVRRVDALFTVADQIETRYAKAKTHVDRLTQSILAKAFRGELVPQDPNDEPAAVLLERFRSQRQAAGVPRRQPRLKGVTAGGKAGIQ
jgi:type I restriction enzyme S subunit